MHISALYAEKLQLTDLCSSQKTALEESKTKASLVDELGVKSENLSSSNKHLALQVRQKEEALKS